MIAGSSQNLATPAIPTLTARTAGSNETALTAAAEIYVNVTALNYFGETIKSAQANVTPTATQVVDVQIRRWRVRSSTTFTWAPPPPST